MKMIECYRGVVHPWLCDAMGHLTTRHYVGMFDDAGYHLLAALGFIWTKYEPESYRWTVEVTEPEGYWPYINMILAQKAAIVGAAFAGFFYVILGILKLLGAWPFNEPNITNFTGSRRMDEIMGGKKAGRFKYKRK